MNNRNVFESREKYAIWAMVGAGREAVGWGLLILAGGIPVYGLMKRRQAGGAP